MMITLTELFKNQVVDDTAHKLKLEKFIPWFETTLLLKSTFGLTVTNSIMKDIDATICNLKNAASECGTPMTNLATLSNRTQRVCDQIDVLYSEYQSGKRCSIAQIVVLYPYNSSLPDSEYTRELISKIKSKLKVIEDISMSKKADSTKSRGRPGEGSSKKAYELPPILKEGLRRLGGLVDELEMESITKSLVLSYLNQIKQTVHRPFHQMRQVISELPQLPQAKQLLLRETEAYRLAAEEYNVARSAAVLQHLAQLRAEMQEVEEAAGDMFSAVRDFVAGPHCKECVRLLGVETDRPSASPLANVLALRLLKYSKYPLSDLLLKARQTE